MNEDTRTAQAEAYHPGSIVRFYDRDWIVLPNANTALLTLKPLGGSEIEVCSVWKRLLTDTHRPQPTNFELPDPNQTGDFASARLLLNASRFLFRSGAGPFRSMGKLSFRPRAYQLVPLIMALKMDPVRLLIADDVGVGKTIEALLIAREMLDRGMIRSTAVLCPPHLCQQWHAELQDKFSIDARIVRSSTISSLQRDLPQTESIFSFYNHFVVSIDIAKGQNYRTLFLQNCPDLVIVDEAHTCARPGGTRYQKQQQRHKLVTDISQNAKQHLILVTATPHSGKPEEFQSLLGLIKPEFEAVDVTNTSDANRDALGDHFVQRRRRNVAEWMGDEAVFPKRDMKELIYTAHPRYKEVFGKVLHLARGISKTQVEHAGVKRIRYYTALGILRGVMSSPAAGEGMLKRRAERRELIDDVEPDDVRHLAAPLFEADDTLSQDTDSGTLEIPGLRRQEIQSLKALSEELAELKSPSKDKKAREVGQVLMDWLKDGFNTILFCKFIETANYLGKVLTPLLQKKFGASRIGIEVITSELSDEERKAKVEDLKAFERKVIFATDCMSEGINLQEQFTGVIHYDLPWNPNRLEQREGRVDRFGQTAPCVRTLLVHGEDNPIDSIVLEVLLKKARAIRLATGISVPFPEDSQTIMESVMTAMLLKPRETDRLTQLQLFEDQDFQQQMATVKEAYERAEEREKQITTIFAQRRLKPEEIEPYLIESDAALGTPHDVENFVSEAVQRFGDTIEKADRGHRLSLTNAPLHLRYALNDGSEDLVSFHSPVPPGYRYLGRNHPFVEALCQTIIKNAFENQQGLSRTSVIVSDAVNTPVTIFLLRVRMLIADRRKEHQHLAEEMILWGYRGSPQNRQWIPQEEALDLIMDARITGELPPDRQARIVEIALTDFAAIGDELEMVTLQHTEQLIEAHEHMRKAARGEKYHMVEPILPADLMGVYVIIPQHDTV